MRYIEAFMTHFKRIAVGVCALAVFALCACTPLSATMNDESDNTIPQYTLPPIEQDPVPAAGGELTFPIPENPSTLNPLKIKNAEIYNLFTLIYEPPIRIGADGKAQPVLAETWEWDETGTVWTFHLRRGVQWQGGYGEMTADDVIYTIGLLQAYGTDDSRFAQTDIISAVSKTDDYTVTITLKQPGNAAIYFMTFPVLCKAYCSSGNIESQTPIGTGPYKVIAYDEDDRMQLEASDVWWHTQPYIKSLTAVCYPDHDVELEVFEQKLLDFITTSILTVDTYKQYGEITSLSYPTGYYDCLLPNVSSGLFSDVRMREAVAYALDKRDIISTALLGHAVATDYPIPPESYLIGDAAELFEYNLSKSKALLEELGWLDRDSDGIAESVEGNVVSELQIELLVLADEDETYRHDVAENIAAQLGECGIDLVIAEETPTVYMNRLQSDNFDIALCSYYLDENPDITFMVGSGESLNYGGFSDATLDTLLLNCKSALGEDAMSEAYTEMEKRFFETLPQISLYFRTNTLIYKTSITIPTEIIQMNILATLPDWYMYTEDTVPVGDETDTEE